MQWNNFGVVALRLLSVVVCDFIVVSCSAVDEPYSTVLCLSLPEYFTFKQESIYSRGTKSWRIYIRRNQSRRQSIQKEKGTTVCHQVFSYLSCAMYMYPDNKPIFTAVQCFFCLRILLMLSGIVIFAIVWEQVWSGGWYLCAQNLFTWRIWSISSSVQSNWLCA